MRQRYRIVLLTAATVLVTLVGLGETTQLLSWAEDIELTWDLFRAAVPESAPSTDLAAIHMELKWHTFHKGERQGSQWVGYTTRVIVSNLMNPQLSWARRDRVNDAALRHETYHFHLNEVYRRKLESALLTVRVCGRTAEETGDLLDRQVHDVADRWLRQAEAIQEKYETETKHGTNAAAQGTWEARIDAWLVDPSSAP